MTDRGSRLPVKESNAAPAPRQWNELLPRGRKAEKDFDRNDLRSGAAEQLRVAEEAAGGRGGFVEDEALVPLRDHLQQVALQERARARPATLKVLSTIDVVVVGTGEQEIWGEQAFHRLAIGCVVRGKASPRKFFDRRIGHDERTGVQRVRARGPAWPPATKRSR